MEKRIPLKTSKTLFYKQVLELLNPVLKLTKKELATLAEIMEINDNLFNVPQEHRSQLIFSSQSRKEMRSKLRQTEASFNNNLSALKKKKILSDKGELKPFLNIPYNSSFNLTFEFRE